MFANMKRERLERIEKIRAAHFAELKKRLEKL